jgi:quercetin dioxygenase-like cupin family protein
MICKMKIVKIDNIQARGISHDPDILKKVLIEKGEIPHLMTFGEAVFGPGQSVEKHFHETMYEVFYITSGKAVFIVNGKSVDVVPGDCITIGPGEVHSQDNPFDEKVKWLYFGIATD